MLESRAGGELPDKLAEFADLCQPKHKQRARVERSSFGGPGANSYSPYCEVEFFRAAPSKFGHVPVTALPLALFRNWNLLIFRCLSPAS